MLDEMLDRLARPLERLIACIFYGILSPFCSLEWKNGTCHRYNGTVCLAYLGNSTMNKEIFFDVKYGVNGTEEILKQFIELSSLFVRESALCK